MQLTKNLETADVVVKLVLAVLVIAFYFGRVISGPLESVLMILGILVIVIFAFKILLVFFTRD